MTQLLIVESPSKAQTIGKYLGGDWVVRASVGHFRDLPKKPKDGGIGVNTRTFEPQYEVQNAKVVAGLRKAAKGVSRIMLATDPDREGEAIAWHLAQVLKINETQANRVTFQEITETEVQRQIQQPRPIDAKLVRAQEARRVLDRLIGYTVSPRLGDKQSAGRVQSPGLRLVVDRERDIANFQSTSHFGVRATDAAGRFIADWDTSQVLLPDQKYVTDQALADAIAKTATLTVRVTDKKQRRVNPPKPFWTSTLQQAASSHLKMSPEETMAAAQKLYEGSHITYMRTDVPRIAEEKQTEIRAYLKNAGKQVPDTPPSYKVKSGSQDAHECIRPTHIEVKIAGDTDAQQQLYRLIRLRTLASQMIAAVYDVNTAEFDADVTIPDGTPAQFKAKGQELVIAGWKDAINVGHDSEDDAPEESQGLLPPMNIGDRIGVSCVRQNKRTSPPGRFTEASLVKALEARGIGRPSTYASIIAGMKKRGYVQIKKRKLHATQAGCAVVDRLVGCKFSFVEYDYTKKLEEELDQIAEGQAQYFDVVSAGFGQLEQELGALPKPEPRQSEPDDTAPCPACQAPMQRIRAKKANKDGTARYFWGCSEYPNCKTVLPEKQGRPDYDAAGDPEHPCPDCGQPMRKRNGMNGAFWGCTGYPKCKTTLPDNDGAPGQRHDHSEQDAYAPECPQCGSAMRQRTVKKGKNKGSVFWGCSNYPKCTTTAPDNGGSPIFD